MCDIWTGVGEIN